MAPRLPVAASNSRADAGRVRWRKARCPRRLRGRAPAGGEGRPGHVAARPPRRVRLIAGGARRRGGGHPLGDRAQLRGIRRRRAVAGGRRRARARAGRRHHRGRGGRAPRRPRPFLRAMRELVAADGLLVLTTPNAYRLSTSSRPSAASSWFPRPHGMAQPAHADDPARAERLGGGGRRLLPEPRPEPRRHRGHARPRRKAAFVRIGRLAPYWSDGLVVSARPAGQVRPG